MKRQLQLNKLFLMIAVMVLGQPGYAYGVCKPGPLPCNTAIAVGQGSYRLIGSIMGLRGTLVLSNNGSDVLTLNGDGMVSFPRAMASGTPYHVAIVNQPASQTCKITNADGVISNANAINLLVNCTTNAYTVNGVLRGLTASQSVMLQNTNNGDNLTLTANGSFAFRVPVAQGSPYSITVIRQPANETCTVQNGSGFIQNFKVMNVDVSCVLSLKKIIR